MRLGSSASALAKIRLSHVWVATGVLIPVIVIAAATLDARDVDVAVLARDQQGQLIPKVQADPGWRLSTRTPRA